jgi:hypothetical protein
MKLKILIKIIISVFIYPFNRTKAFKFIGDENEQS